MRRTNGCGVGYGKLGLDGLKHSIEMQKYTAANGISGLRGY